MPGAEFERTREDTNFIVGATATIVAGLFWGLQLFGFAPSQFAILNPVGETHPALWPPSRICAAFLMIHSLRLWLGITFLDTDESFVAAVEEREKTNKAEMASAARTHRILLVMIYLSVSLGAIFAPVLGFIWLSIALALQAVGLIMLDVNWWPVLISKSSKDKERAANKFFIVGDVIVFLFMVVVISCALFISADGPSDSHVASALFMALCGSLLAIFAGECWSQYWEALKLRWKTVGPREAQP